MDKKKFAADMERARNLKGWNQDQAAEALNVSRTTIGNWENPNSPIDPLPKRWELIRNVMGIDCSEYQGSTFNQGDQSQGVIVAKDHATVNAGCDFGGSSKFTVTLTEFEHRIFLLFRQYGNQAIADRCLKQLQAMQAMSTL